ARPAGTGVAAVAEELVVTRRGVGRMHAGTGAIAAIVGTDVAIAAARRARRRGAGAGRFATGAVTLAPRPAGIAGMGRARPAAALIGAVAERAVVAGCGVGHVGADAGAVADIVRARIGVGGAGGARRLELARRGATIARGAVAVVAGLARIEHAVAAACDGSSRDVSDEIGLVAEERARL